MKAKIKVNLVGFGDKGVRFVDIELPNTEKPVYREVSVDYILNQVFHFGQNDFQPQQVRSVSAGDVIELKFRVETVGFSLISEKD